MRDDKLTRQGVRNLDLIGPRPPKRTVQEHVHTWTGWTSSNEDMGGIVYEVRTCVSCGERDGRSWDPYAVDA